MQPNYVSRNSRIVIIIRCGDAIMFKLLQHQSYTIRSTMDTCLIRPSWYIIRFSLLRTGVYAGKFSNLGNGSRGPVY
jgi:hypothetical protein